MYKNLFRVRSNFSFCTWRSFMFLVLYFDKARQTSLWTYFGRPSGQWQTWKSWPLGQMSIKDVLIKDVLIISIFCLGRFYQIESSILISLQSAKLSNGEGPQTTFAYLRWLSISVWYTLSNWDCGKMFFSFLRDARPPATFPLTDLYCSFQLSLSSTVSPRYLVLWTCFILILSR